MKTAAKAKEAALLTTASKTHLHASVPELALEVWGKFGGKAHSLP